MVVEGIYKRTGLCPYTAECDSYRTIAESERWMERALSSLRRAGADSHTEADREYSEESLVDKLEHLRKVRERCYGHNGRCLRFWQFEKRNKETESLDRLQKRLAVIEGIISPAPEKPSTQQDSE